MNSVRLEESLKWSFVGCLTLCIVGYFLLPTAQASNFPTYLFALVALSVGLIQGYLSELGKSSVMIATITFVSYLVISLGWSSAVSVSETISTVGNCLLILFLIVGIRISSIKYSKTTNMLAAVVVAGATVSCIHYLYLDLIGADVVVPPGRWNTVPVAAIGYGFALILSVHLLLSETRWVSRLLYVLALLILGYTCIQLNTDFVWLAIALSLTTLSFAKVWEKRDSSAAFIWVAVSAVAMIIFLILFSVVLDSSRPMLWDSVVNLIYSGNPVIGEGILAELMPLICSSQISAGKACEYVHAHNVFVSTMYYGGIIGLGLLSLLLLTTLSVVFESNDERKWIVLSMLAYGFGIMLFDGDKIISKINFIWLVFWLPIGLAVCLELDEKLDED